ncbi:hypothetical protein [Wenjunlia tyrosinilytica]|uniref:hypothetical protein n=1 Tax=Wenjunlia tyrosinilytica TaxID=1544741 RepID=UPI00166D9EE8|nr:hypothetical protein [Wenjunlia tyrosinilytica]
MCIRTDPEGYDAKVEAGMDLHGHMVDLNLMCANGHWFGDQGKFNVFFSMRWTYVFRVGSQGACQVLLYDDTTKETWASPWAYK